MANAEDDRPSTVPRRFCGRCGVAIRPEDNFCERCGAHQADFALADAGRAAPAGAERPPSGAASAQPAGADAAGVTPRDAHERLRAAWRAFAAAHPALLARLRVAWRLWSWTALLALLLALVFVPETRRAFVVFVLLQYGMLQLFLLARTKTLSWAALGRFFAAGALAVAPAIALVDLAVTVALGGEVSGAVASIWLAGVSEELAKLAPLVAFLLLARIRARGLGLADFALAGLATGAGFQFTEDAVRRMTLGEGQYLIGALLGRLPEYRFSDFLPGATELGSGVIFAGHHVYTALCALGLGLSLRRLGRGRPRAWLPLAALLWLAILDHSLFNASVDYGAVPVPDILMTLYGLWGAGAEALPLLVVLFALALVLDRRALASAAPSLPALPGAPAWGGARSAARSERSAGSGPDPGPVAHAPPPLEEDPGRRLAAALERGAHELAAALASFGGELYALALAAGAGRAEYFAALVLVRERRALGFSLARAEAAGGQPPRAAAEELAARARRLSRALAVAGAASLALLLGAGLSLAGVAGVEGAGFFAGLLESLGQWWGSPSGAARSPPTARTWPSSCATRGERCASWRASSGRARWRRSSCRS